MIIAFFSLYFPVSFFYLLPPSVLGSLLVYTGLEHSMLVDVVINSKKDFYVAIATGSFAFITKNLILACFVGWLIENLRKELAILEDATKQPSLLKRIFGGRAA